MKRYDRYYDIIEQKITNWATSVGKKASEKSNKEKNSDKPGKSIPHGTRSQLDEYRARKKLLFKRMKLGAIAMCFLIIFLAWLQDYIPSYNKKFWSRGTS